MRRTQPQPWENPCIQPPDRLPRVTEPRPALPPKPRGFLRSLAAKLVRRP
jgi:hypothetical protein